MISLRSTRKGIKKTALSLLSMTICLSASPCVNAKDNYSTNPSALLESISELHKEDDDTFYNIAKDNLSEQAYDYLVGDVADDVDDDFEGSNVGDVSGIVDACREEADAYHKQYGNTNNGDKYRKWFLGHADGANWCGTWVAYILAKKVGLIKKEQVVESNWGIATNVYGWFKSHSKYGTCHDASSNYTPQAGDIVVFGTEIGKTGGHVGFCTSSTQFISGNYGSKGIAEGSIAGQAKTKPVMGYITPTVSLGTVKGSNGQAVIKIFRQAGYSGAAAAGIVGNLWQETGGHTFNFKPKTDVAAGYGIFQMTNTRRSNCISWCKANGLDPYTADAQCKYMIKVDIDQQFCQPFLSRPVHYGAKANVGSLSEFKKMTDPAEAARVWAAVVERCSSGAAGNLDGRAKAAKQAYEKWGR